jgi:L-lactate utilization protein LutB
MDLSMEAYWELRLQRCRQALEKNNFEAFVAQSPSDAEQIVVDRILPANDIKSVSYGDSMTLFATGILERFKAHPAIELIDTFEAEIPREIIAERRRQALLTDLFFTGANAVVETGMLVNLDMVGNRVGGVVFGPKLVVIAVGRNKLVPNLETAMERVKNLAAPANAIRHAVKTPCVKTACCMDCKSPDRICNVWTIHEKSYPRGRIKVILINRDLGL